MLSNRKRKASPDKSPEDSKTRKLKVSNKIFRSPVSPKQDSSAKTKISNLLPEGYDSIILTASTKPEENTEGSEAIYGCVRLPIITREDALIWVKKFERKTSTSYRPQKSWKNDLNAGLFKRTFLCDYQNPDVAGEVYSCKACIIFTIKDAKEIQTNPDYYLRDYPSQVIIQFCHNHHIDPDDYMKHLYPSTELQIIFDKYFANGHSPFSALICHKCDLHSSYGAEFYDVISNSAICPSYNWCIREFEKLFARRFVEPQEDELIEKLTGVISQYNTKCDSECVVFSKDSCYLLSLCTPFMKSVFTSGFAEDLITVRSFCTPKTSPRRQKLILFLCHTPIGSLPFGIVLTYAEDAAIFCEGIKALLKMLGAPSYSPKTIITDEHSLISKSLRESFPNSQVVFNEFQMLQSVWRILRLVCEDDNEEFQALYNLFSVTLNSGCEEDFKGNFDSLAIYAERYPKLTNFMKYFKLRANAYVLYARPKVEFNTDVLNYTDSGTIILQDVSIKYRNFFNILQLFDFLTKSYVDHYERKLMKIIEGDLKGFFKTNFYVPLDKIANFTCVKVTDTEFVVTLNGIKFFVNAELDTCTCQVGVHGGSCVHQYIVEKNIGLVPECYTPLGDDMLGVLKAILSYKDSSSKALGSGLDSVKSELEPFTDDAVSEFISPAETVNVNDVPQDVENLGPVDEIYLAPSKVTDSFTDDMTSLALSEFDDPKGGNHNFSNDSEQYNRECGELQRIFSPVDANNVTSLKQSSPVDIPQLESIETILEDKKLPEVNIDEKKNDNEVDFVVDESMVISAGIDGCNISENTLEARVDVPVVYTYTTEKEGDIQIYGQVMRESDKKTAEIAEFLTNLPDTNNSYSSALTSTHTTAPTNNLLDELQNSSETDPKGKTDTIQDSEETVKYVEKFQEQTSPTQETEITPEGVVVMKDDEFFTQYKIMENGVLSIMADSEEDQTKFQATSTQNSAGNSYEESNLILMSSDDLFDNDCNVESSDGYLDKSGSRINVLSSVVIKPPLASCINEEMFISQAPLNLNTIRHKTLRNVKQSNRSRVSESKPSQAESAITVHTIPKPVVQKVSKIIENRSQARDDSGLNVSSELTDECAKTDQVKATDCKDETVEKDVIQLYCNQSGNEAPLENKSQCEYKMCDEQAVEQATSDSVADEISDEVKVKAKIIDDEINTTGELSEDLNLTDCDPEQLAKENIVEVIEIDSDDLEELASQEHDNLSLGIEKEITHQVLQKSPLKVVTLQGVPTTVLPLKAFSTSESSQAKTIPLRDFMTQISPKKMSSKKSDNSPHKQTCTYSKKENINKSGLDRQINTAFSQLTDLACRNNFKAPVKKFLGKCKELESSNITSTFQKLIAAGISIKRGADLKINTGAKAKHVKSIEIPQPIYGERKSKGKNPEVRYSVTDGSTSDETDDLQETRREYSNTSKWKLEVSDDDSSSTDTDDFSCTELEHFSDCRTSCSEIHSELDELDEFSDYDFYESNLPGVKLEVKTPEIESDCSDTTVGNILAKSEQDFVDKHIRYIKNPFGQQFQWAKGNLSCKSLGGTSENKKKSSVNVLAKINPMFQYTQSKQVKSFLMKKSCRKEDLEIMYSDNENIIKNKPGGRVSTNIKAKLSKLPQRKSDSSYFIKAEDEKVDTEMIKTSKELNIPSVGHDFFTSKSKGKTSSSFIPGIRISTGYTTPSNMVNLERQSKLPGVNPGKSFSTFKNGSTSVFSTETKKCVDSFSVTRNVSTINKGISSTHMEARTPKNQASHIKTAMTKHAKELESILTDGVDFDSQIHNISHPEIKVEETPIFMNNELSFLFNDSRFETIIENSGDFVDEVKTEYTDEFDEIDVSDIKVEPCSFSPEYTQNLDALAETVTEVQIPPLKKSKARKNKSELKRTGCDALVYDKKDPNKNKKQKDKPATKKVSKEIKELKRLAEVFTKEIKQERVKIEKNNTGNKTARRKCSKGLEDVTHSRRGKNVTGSKMKDAKVINPLSVVKNIEKRDRRKTEPFDGSPVKKLVGSKRTYIKVEKEVESETPVPVVKPKKENRKTPKEKRITKKEQPHVKKEQSHAKKEDTIFKNVQPIKDFKPAYSSKGFGKIRAVVKPFHKISHTDNSLDSVTSLSKSVLERESIQENIQKGQSSFITSTPIKPVGYAGIFKKYLETAKVSCGTDKMSKSFSHYDDCKDRKKLDVGTHIRKRKKSDLTVVISESDSDVSEIRAGSVVRKRERSKSKRKSVFSNNEKMIITDNISKQDSSSLSKSQLTNKGPAKQRMLSNEKQKRANNRRDSKHHFRYSNGDKRLVVRLERIKKIELMCRRLKVCTLRSSRSSCRERRGYKELLENAKRLKDL